MLNTSYTNINIHGVLPGHVYYIQSPLSMYLVLDHQVTVCCIMACVKNFLGLSTLFVIPTAAILYLVLPVSIFVAKPTQTIDPMVEFGSCTGNVRGNLFFISYSTLTLILIFSGIGSVPFNMSSSVVTLLCCISVFVAVKRDKM